MYPRIHTSIDFIYYLMLKQMWGLFGIKGFYVFINNHWNHCSHLLTPPCVCVSLKDLTQCQLVLVAKHLIKVPLTHVVCVVSVRGRLQLAAIGEWVEQETDCRIKLEAPRDLNRRRRLGSMEAMDSLWGAESTQLTAYERRDGTEGEDRRNIMKYIHHNNWNELQSQLK